MTRPTGLSVRTAWLAAATLIVVGCTQVSIPLIDDLGPDGTLAGDPGFVLSIIGRNFDPDATVSFGGPVKEVTRVSENQLDISVDASEVATPGQIAVVVTNPDPDLTGSEESASMIFTVHPISELRVEAQPDVAVASDGKPVYATTELGALTATAIGGSFFSRDVTLEADWSSSDDAVATVSDGLVGPQAEGTVTFQATLDGVIGSLDAHVVEPATLSLQPSSLSVPVGDVAPLSVVTARGLILDAAAEWATNAPNVAELVTSGAPVLVRGLAEGTATVTASLYGESLTSEITVFNIGGGGQTSAERMFIIPLNVEPDAFAIPFDPTTLSFGESSVKLTLSGSPLSSAYDRTEKILVVSTSEGIDVISNEPSALAMESSTSVDDMNHWGALRYSPTRGDFTAEDVWGDGVIHQVRVDPSGEVTTGVAVDGLPALPASGHAFFPSPVSGEIGFVWLSPPNVYLAGSGTIESTGSVSEVTTYSLDTGMLSNVAVTSVLDESIAFVMGFGGVVAVGPDEFGAIGASSPVAPLSVSGAGIAVDRTSACGYAWTLNGSEIEVLDLGGGVDLESIGVQTLDGYMFIDQVIEHPTQDALFTMGRNTDDEAVVDVYRIDLVTCEITWQNQATIGDAGPGFLAGSFLH